MATVRGGPLYIALERDEEGQRVYTVPFQVEVDSTPGNAEGPQAVLQAAGLPVPGSIYLIGQELDPWAFCTRYASVQPDPSIPMTPGGPVKFYIATFQFKSPGKAEEGEQATCTGDVENPLFQPMIIRRSFADWSEEAVEDRHGNRIENSAWEPIQGPEVEFETSREIITIEQNVINPEDSLLDEMKDTVNRDVLWGKPRRSIRFVLKDVQRKFYGTCFRYYTRVMEFRVRIRKHPTTGFLVGDWDRNIPDRGYSALNGHWAATASGNARWVLDPIPGYSGTPNPNPFDPSHFLPLPGPNNLPLVKPRDLDGQGKPYEASTVTTPVTGCTRCTNGAPQEWIVSGFGEDQTISYQGSSCHWAGGTVTLSFDDPNNVWLLTSSSHPGIEWEVPLTSFRCMQANTLRATSLATPDSVTIRPVYDSERGVIRVQKYGEADYMLLGVPATL